METKQYFFTQIVPKQYRTIKGEYYENSRYDKRQLNKAAVTIFYSDFDWQFAVAVYFTTFSILRALGDSKTPLIFLIVCSLLNIVLDLLLVVVFQTGVAGAAAATVLSEAIAAVLCIIYAFKKVPQFGQAFIYRKPDAKLIKKTMQVGIPTGFQYALIYVSSIFLTCSWRRTNFKIYVKRSR